MTINDLKKNVAEKTGYPLSAIDIMPTFQALAYKDGSTILSFVATTTSERYGCNASQYAMTVKGRIDAKYEKEIHEGKQGTIEVKYTPLHFT